MRILLFDWLVAGHHEIHVRRFAAALQDHDVIVAVPDELAARVGDAAPAIIPLGPAPAVIDTSRYLSVAARLAARREHDLFRRAVAQARPDHAVALYGDGLVRSLARGRAVPAATTLSVFRPRAHYPELYGARQGRREGLAARAFERAVRRWRRRPDAHALLTLDEGAAELWSRAPGAPAYALPEPLLAASRRSAARDRRGAVVFGALAPRKGIELVAAATALGGSSLQITLAGAVEPGYEDALAAAVADMRAAGAVVDLIPRWLDDAEAVELLARAQCAMLPYPRHYGMSGVLAEAAAVGTPVLVHDWGLLAHVTRAHGLGLAVDCTSPAALRAGLLEMAGEGADPGRYAAALARYADRHSPERFRAAVREVFAG